MKRAKEILKTPTIKTSTANPSLDHGYSVLDQSNLCNVFLKELLCAFLKIPLIRFETNYMAKYLCSRAASEARRLFEATKKRRDGNGLQSKELKNIVDHIEEVVKLMTRSPHEAKNIIRAVLGEPEAAEPSLVDHSNHYSDVAEGDVLSNETAETVASQADQSFHFIGIPESAKSLSGDDNIVTMIYHCACQAIRCDMLHSEVRDSDSRKVPALEQSTRKLQKMLLQLATTMVSEGK